ncbi:MAG TPA: sulfotransferase [Thermoanaerobaculia bacterium]|nr:sulfotransferase [Thermoanaerobaculia bacterium]
MTNLVYIMGHGYSGSTLLTFLLGSHPQIATIGELGIAPLAKNGSSAEQFLCSCRTPIAHCGFWERVAREMGERGHEFDVWDADLEFRAPGGGISDVLLRAVQRGPLLESARSAGLAVVPPARRRLGQLLSRIEALAETVSGIKGCNTFLDASKRPERAMFMRRIPSFDMKVIHLVRDGRAVSWSSMKNLGIGPEAAADSWLADNHGAEHAKRYFPKDRWMTLRHEDVCADPLSMLSRVYNFIGVPAKNGVHDFRAYEHHIIGNRMRLSSTTEIRLDDRWKTALTPEQMKVIDKKVAPLNERYGYGAL